MKFNKKKDLTEVDKDLEIASLKQLAENYKKTPKSRKREIVPFELELGNFCCKKMNKEFKDNKWSIIIQDIGGHYFVWLDNKVESKNHCPYCQKLVKEFFYIKEY